MLRWQINLVPVRTYIRLTPFMKRFQLWAVTTCLVGYEHKQRVERVVTSKANISAVVGGLELQRRGKPGTR